MPFAFRLALNANFKKRGEIVKLFLSYTLVGTLLLASSALAQQQPEPPPDQQPTPDQPKEDPVPGSQPAEEPEPEKSKGEEDPGAPAGSPALAAPSVETKPGGGPGSGHKHKSREDHPGEDHKDQEHIGGEPGSGEKVYEDEDVVVTGTRTKKRIKDTPVKTELVRAEQIEAKGAVNLAQALAFEPGVRIDNQCSICNTTAIKLSGLPGRYTLVMVDGLPVYTSLGLVYGLLQMDTANIKQVEVVKGANSVLYGTDAIGGVVNVITMEPKEGGQGAVFVEGGSFGSLRIGGYAGYGKGPLSITTVASYSQHDKVDREGDGISEYAGFDSLNASFTGRYRFSARASLMLNASVTHENRQGGGLGSIIEVLNDYKANPDTTKGESYGRRAFTETILTRRYGGGALLKVQATDSVELTTQLVGISHRQDSDYEGEVYVGDQTVVFAAQQVGWQALASLHLLGGVTYRYEGLSENLAVSEYHYHIPGLFLQGDWSPLSWLELVPGFRFDYHNEFGAVPTPRIALKVAPLDWLTLRTVFGTGFRAPTTFYEYAHGVRPQGYTLHVADDIGPENSIGSNTSVTLDLGRKLNVTAEFGYNRITDPITVEVAEAASGSVKEGDVVVDNADGSLAVYATELQVQSQPLSWLALSAGYGYYAYDNAEVLVSAPPEHQATLAVTFDIKKIGTRINVAAEIVGPMDLSEVYGEGYNLQAGLKGIDAWLDHEANADPNNPKLKESPTYGLLNLRLEQNLGPLMSGAPFGKEISLYFGVDNLLDYHQSDTETPLYFPADDAGKPTPADVVYIWGPMRGRYIYGGVKLKI